MTPVESRVRLGSPASATEPVAVASILLNWLDWLPRACAPPAWRQAAMKIRAGYEIAYECPQPTPMLLMLSVHPSRAADLARRRTASPSIRPSTARDYRDVFGNICTRIVAPPGRLTDLDRFHHQRLRARPTSSRRDAQQVASRGSARRRDDLPARQPLLRHRPASPTWPGRCSAAGRPAGPRAGHLRLRQRAADLRLPARLRHAHGAGTASASSAACAATSRISPSRSAAA